MWGAFWLFRVMLMVTGPLMRNGRTNRHGLDNGLGRLSPTKAHTRGSPRP